MSTFYRPQQLIQQIVHRNLEEIAESEGREAIEFCKVLDVAVDFDYRSNGYRVAVAWKGAQSFGFLFGMNEATAMATKVEDIDHELTAFMKKNLSLAAQLLHARLDKQFPNAIQRVETEHVAATCSKNFKVVFKNGHFAETSEHESKSDLFIARCMMLYDLPPL